jgi:hypothetical protein
MISVLGLASVLTTALILVLFAHSGLHRLIRIVTRSQSHYWRPGFVPSRLWTRVLTMWAFWELLLVPLVVSKPGVGGAIAVDFTLFIATVYGLASIRVIARCGCEAFEARSEGHLVARNLTLGVVGGVGITQLSSDLLGRYMVAVATMPAAVVMGYIVARLVRVRTETLTSSRRARGEVALLSSS